MKIRRVVTGHDEQGRARVEIDEISTAVTSFRKGATACAIWSTEKVPANNMVDEDGALRVLQPGATALHDGSVFRIIEFAPGVTPRRHRTVSIDYGLVLSGEIDMELDGCEVHLRAGDALVQRGTVHNWYNRGNVPCVIAFILIAAEPIEIGGKTLAAEG